MRRQSELLGLNRSSLYYQPEPKKDDVEIMNEMRDIQQQWSFYGYRRVHVELCARGFILNRKRVQRLMRVAGLIATYPKPKTSIAVQGHVKYPYLLRDLTITARNQAWCIDITYIRTTHGFVYLVALIDCFSRRVMGWELSAFLDTQACLTALQAALTVVTPSIINSDQGCQFTSEEWINTLQVHGIQISMDGKGRWADNILIERLWRSLKYELVYLNSYESISDARDSIKRYLEFYNARRPHQSLGYRTPNNVYENHVIERRTEQIIQQSSILIDRSDHTLTNTAQILV